MLPFFATFAVGILIAGLFGGFNGPRFGRGERGRRFQEFQRLQFENEQQRNEILRLKNELENRGEVQELRLNWNGSHHDDFRGMKAIGPEVPVVGPMPAVPPSPHTHK